MSSTFTGFSEEDLVRIKSVETGPNNEPKVTSDLKKSQIGIKQKRIAKKPPPLLTQNSDDAIDSIVFDKCRLSLKIKGTEDNLNNNDLNESNNDLSSSCNALNDEDNNVNEQEKTDDINELEIRMDNRKNSIDIAPDLVKSLANYTEDEIAAHRAKLGELQLKQKLMEEQNKKRKEMLAKALADRTKQTEEEVLRLEKIKKELQVLDGQFSQDVSVLRKKIDHACLSYADAEKHYLKVEKEFLQAKINLQKEKEKKELLTEHLCALITHNETRKAQKLETLMLELASDKKGDVTVSLDEHDEDNNPVIVDGVDERTGKMVEINHP